ncbi:TIGR03862 family flavoprotein [Sagittula sp. SSi028]|uniref:TIGR03862 family flavoprotein n=1 Tax=Sagittula sp. SSi028 TaxID=3400636 RepID=UPI003AF83E35
MSAVIIGGGPAGLMAAEALLSQGIPTLLAEAKPSLARKLLMAGKSGLNLTKIENHDAFCAQFGAAHDHLRPMLDQFGPEQVRAWAEGLGQPCFTGSTGRLFPEAMKGSPLLRAWLARLDAMGLERRLRWRWTGWSDAGLRFETPEGPQHLTPQATVLAMGGASWARLGSDGLWAQTLRAEGIALSPFQPSNVGLLVDWSPHMRPHFGAPLKNVTFHAGGLRNRGEAIISARGLEGGGLYPVIPAVREDAALTVDLLPDLDEDKLCQRLSKPRSKQSLSNHLRKLVKLSPATQALLMEMARPLPTEPRALARTLKAMPLRHNGPRPMDEAISTAGGVPFDALDAGLMLRSKPGVFCAGEMLDWDAPTGGYLLTASMATGLWAGQHAANHIRKQA